MKFIRFRIAILGFLLLLICSGGLFAQTTKSARANEQAAKSTAAYAELLLRKTDLESALEDLLVAYKEEFPKVKETRFELDLIQKDLARLLALGAGDTPKMTLALGKLLVRRAELQTDLWSARSQYGDEHPNVERAKRRVASFDKAIGEILP